MATLTIDYNGYQVTEAEQINKLRFREDYGKLFLTFEFVLSAASAAALTTLCIAARAALTEWDKALTVTFGNEWFTLDPAANTGFLARPLLEEVGDDLDTETSRHYRLSIEVQLPADAAGDGGRQTGTYSIAWDGYRRRVATFDAEYTAVGSDSALTTATTNGPAWALSVLSAIGGTYDTVQETVTPEHRTKKARYRAVYREQKEADSSAGHVANVIDSEMTYSMDLPSEMGTNPLNPQSVPGLATATVNYSGTLAAAAWPDGNSARTTYFDSVRPWLLSRLKDILDTESSPFTSAGRMIALAPGERFTASRSSGRFAGQIVVGLTGVDLVFYDEKISQQGTVGDQHEKLYDGEDHTHASWGIGAELYATSVVTASAIGRVPEEPAGLAPPWEQTGPFGEEMSAKSWGANSALIGAGTDTAIVHTRTWTRTYIYSLAGSGGPQTTGDGAAGNGGSGSQARPVGPTFRVNEGGGVQLVAFAAPKG